METTKFIGQGKSFGKKIQISFEWELLKKLTKQEFKGKKYLVVDVIPLKETGQFGHTHTVVEHVHQEKEA
jgi:predicted lipoprotein